MIKKSIIFNIILVSIYFLSVKNIKASSEYQINSIIEYKIRDEGYFSVTHTITLTNITTEKYAKYYIINLSNQIPVNIKVYEKGEELPVEINKINNDYSLKITFVEPVLGKNNSRTFIVTYDEKNILQKNGDVLEFSLPLVNQEYSDCKILISVPETVGDLAYITPDKYEIEKQNNRIVYKFSKNLIKNQKINAIFGKFKVYSIKVNIPLKNYENKNKEIKFAIPPDTSMQKVYYNKLEPLPNNIYVDEDGNWIATYLLKPKENINLNVEGYIQVFSRPLKLFRQTPSSIISNLKPQIYWESDDPLIKNLTENFKNPKEIYDYVVDNLIYNYKRISPNADRYGAKKALLNKNDSLCTEFTDLFIALSRASGIPAREINGYAYSDNINIKPLSLISDIFHSWPEYWDEDLQDWKPIDPTWESTSNIDYFNGFDLNHITLLIHGKSSTYPSSPIIQNTDDIKKNLYIYPSSLPNIEIKPLIINHKIVNYLNPFKKELNVIIKNETPIAFYNINPIIYFENKKIITEKINVLPPMSYKKIVFNIPVGFLALDSPNKISIEVNNYINEIYLNKAKLITIQLIYIFSIFIFIILFLLIILNMNLIKSILAKINIKRYVK